MGNWLDQFRHHVTAAPPRRTSFSFLCLPSCCYVIVVIIVISCCSLLTLVLLPYCLLLTLPSCYLPSCCPHLTRSLRRAMTGEKLRLFIACVVVGAINGVLFCAASVTFLRVLRAGARDAYNSPRRRLLALDDGGDMRSSSRIMSLLGACRPWTTQKALLLMLTFATGRECDMQLCLLCCVLCCVFCAVCCVLCALCSMLCAVSPYFLRGGWSFFPASFSALGSRLSPYVSAELR